MKILGIKKGNYSSDLSYIVEISHVEIAAVNDLSYSQRDSFKPLEAGTEYPISQGHDFRNEIVAACTAMNTAYDRFQKAASTMAAFATLVRDND